MSLRFLGAGGAFSRKYGTTCSLLVSSRGDGWLIDCGRQAPDQVWAAGLNWHQMRGQIVTHVHGDHVYGLEDFAFMRYYERRDGVEPVVAGGPRPLLVAHSAVRTEIWEALGASLRYLKGADGNRRSGTLDHYFEVVEAGGFEPPAQNPWRHSERFECAGLALIARESEHVPGKPSCSLEISVPSDRPGQIAWWSGDCTVDAAYLQSLEPRTSIYFHDCTFTDYPGQVHGSFTLLRELPESVRKKMILMHHEDDIENHRGAIESLGFRLGLPGQTYDLVTGRPT
jgi:ribonuclease BN (tRNA processing enzyme)